METMTKFSKINEMQDRGILTGKHESRKYMKKPGATKLPGQGRSQV